MFSRADVREFLGRRAVKVSSTIAGMAVSVGIALVVTDVNEREQAQQLLDFRNNPEFKQLEDICISHHGVMLIASDKYVCVTTPADAKPRSSSTSGPQSQDYRP